MRDKRTASTRTFGAFLMLIFVTSCTGDDCAWARKIVVDERDVLVRSTAEQIVAHNRKVGSFCR